MEKIYISREGLQNLKEELIYLNEKRMHVAAAIEHARSLGDLKENAEYHSAKEEQAMTHARIKDIGDKISRSVVLEDQEFDETKAFVGAKVRVLNKKTKKEVTFILVSPVEADMASGKISVKSPVGAALVGASVGDVAIAKVPAGDISFEVLEISR